MAVLGKGSRYLHFGPRFSRPGATQSARESCSSYLLDLLQAANPDCQHERMPKGDPLSERAIAEVSAWITAGAPTTEADVSEHPNQSVDEPTSEDAESTEMDHEDVDVATPEMNEEKDAGARQDAGRKAGKDAGRDAGKDAGRDAGR